MAESSEKTSGNGDGLGEKRPVGRHPNQSGRGHGPSIKSTIAEYPSVLLEGLWRQYWSSSSIVYLFAGVAVDDVDVEMSTVAS